MMMARALAFLVCGAWVGAGGAPGAEKPVTAADVLSACGRRQGLCVLIGCGTQAAPALAADLAAGGSMLVHGIALDDAALARARAAIAAKGVGGLASVERLPLKPLPYRDNLANVVVVEDLPAATKAGLTTEEALRVLAPGGALCVRKAGKWDVTRKPWPKEMDDWTHECHGPDGSSVSNDKVVRWPVGYRWNAGLPMNLQNPKRNANAWSSTRGMAVTGGRCFMLSDSVLENLGATYAAEHGTDQFVTARDAFNGLLLWRRNIGATYYGGLFYPNRAPFAAVGDRVYVAAGTGKLLALDAATGEIARTFDTTYVPGVILVDRDVIVAATWKEGAQVGGVSGVDRRWMTFGLAEGAVEAFDVTAGRKLWSVDRLATSMRSADGLVYLVTRRGADKLEELGGKPAKDRKGEQPVRPEQAVLAVEIQSGKVRWEVKSDVLGLKDALRLDAAGCGAVAVGHNNGERTSLLAADDGKVLLQAKAGSYAAFYEGELHLGPRKYDPKTGKETGSSTFNLGRTICTPRYFVNGMMVNNRGCGFVVDGKSVSYGGARGGCLFASIPAFGAFFTPQNWCRCAPSQIGGFVCFGPIAHEPTPEEMEQAPPIEAGPAYGEGSGAASLGDWPAYRHDAERSNAATAPAPTTLDVLWSRAICPPASDGRVAANWREALTASVTAPIVAQDLLVVAATDRHEVVAMDALSGKERWRVSVGGRVDTPPTVHQGLCLFGAHDGWVYALDVRDGRLAWRMRAAPADERMVSYGQVESVWPAVGTVLVRRGVGYASVGRSQGSDGGLVVRAFDPATGKVRWSKAVAPGRNTREMRTNDLLVACGDAVQLMTTRLDANSGQAAANPTVDFEKLRREDRAGKTAGEIAPSIGLEGFACGNWTRLGNRKYGAMQLGNVSGELLSWGEIVACVSARGTRVEAVRRDKLAPAGAPRAAGAVLWTHSLPPDYQATAVIACPNAVVVGGDVCGKGAPGGKGFVRVLSAEKGELLAECSLPARLSYNGLIVANGLLYATLRDGSAVCLGPKPPAK